MIRRAVSWAMVVVVLGAALAAWGLDPRRPLNQFSYQEWQSNSGLPQDSIRAVLQSSDGYLWLATDGGVIRFNGLNFRVFDSANTPQMHSNVVHSLTEGENGALWISTANGLLHYDQHQFHLYDSNNGLKSSAVWFVHKDHGGALWAATSAGLSLFLDGAWKSVPGLDQDFHPGSERLVSDAPDGSVWFADGSRMIQLDGRSHEIRQNLKLETEAEIDAIACDPQGRLWVGTPQGLEIYSQGQFRSIALSANTHRFPVNVILPIGPESAWIGSGQGLYSVNLRGTARVEKISALSSAAVTALLLDRHGVLWVGTDRGIVRFYQGRADSFPPGTDMPVSTISALLEDREGNLWVGGESEGLAVLRDQKFTTFTKREGLTGNKLTSIYGDRDGTLWIGTDGSGLNRMTPKGFLSYRINNGLSSDVILALAADPQGGLWIGTATGLNYLYQRKVRKYTVEDGLADDFIRSLFVDRDGSLWIGTRHGLTHKIGAHFFTYSSLDGLGSDFVGAILRMRDGRLWVGTTGGLSVLEGKTFRTLTTRDGLSNDVITAMFEDSDGRLWLGTNGGGLNKLVGNKVQPILDKSLPAIIYGILQDFASDLWISSPSGVYQIDRSGLNRDASLQITAYGTGDGMKSRECSSGHPEAWMQPDGSLWFATVRGVASIVPGHFVRNSVPPQTVIENVLIDDRPELSFQNLVLGPGRHRVEFQYAGLSFVRPELNTYRYQLKGYDRNWIDAGHLRSAYYTNLPPGRYTFQVFSSNNDGIWAEAPIEVSFRIKPYFYQTVWFYAVLVITAAFFAWLGHRWNSRRVQAEFNAVLVERNRIAREIHDTLAQDIVSISLQLEVIARLLGGPVDTLRAQLDRTRDLVKKSLVDARSSIWALRSQDRENTDLPARMASELTGAGRDSSTRVRFDVQGTYRPLERRIEDQLLRIGKEAVSNVLRHAEASQVDVTLFYNTDAVRLSVIDDGKGFDPETVHGHREGHFGLQGMRERASEIQAVFEIQSQTGQGTKVCVELHI